MYVLLWLLLLENVNGTNCFGLCTLLPRPTRLMRLTSALSRLLLLLKLSATALPQMLALGLPNTLPRSTPRLTASLSTTMLPLAPPRCPFTLRLRRLLLCWLFLAHSTSALLNPTPTLTVLKNFFSRAYRWLKTLKSRAYRGLKNFSSRAYRGLKML